nr:hypothetical protein [Halomonas socia]
MALATGVAAIIGASTGVASLGWQIFKHLKDGPVLRLSVSQGMELIVPGREPDDQLLTVVNVTNVGSQSTTLTHLIVERYRNRFDRALRRKPLAQGLVPRPGAMDFPHKLAVGDQWIGTMYQQDLDRYFTEKGHLYIGVYHTFGKRSRVVRITPRGQSLKPYPGEPQS